MGTDGCGSIEGTDILHALYLAALLQKLRGDHTGWVGATEAYHAATMGGAKALGREKELGAIEVGRIADLVGYRLDAIAFTPLNNPVNQLVYSATPGDVALVIVDGDVIQQDGTLTRVDEAALIAEIHEAHARIEPQLTASEADVDVLSGPYERIYRRCQCMGIAHDTFPARFSH
jgi:guanine deaminase